ncbi:hypothetical protein AMS68_005179 [Peltaster fructicola]|uniref:Ketoreductase (KR) domain-containing protein n=1 Tax=Peltaster fructicola TaxID=286661 RepID=A0A6H0XY16_9PEZI|nr:hypothetical protein AMS68_005179 [Peltaster fructicola]
MFFSGTMNKSERKMNGKVAIVTVRVYERRTTAADKTQGGTSGVGAAVVRDLASRGTQLVLLTQHSLNDPFIVEFIDDLRTETNNELITAEQVDISSLHSIRQFATKWIDNAPPRRLDLLVLCANTMTFNQSKISSTSEGVETTWQVNYLANFHLMSILSPALRAQPPDRDVRVLFGSCSSYLGGDLTHITTPEKTKTSKTKKLDAQSPTKFSPGSAYATSKLALTAFALAFQKHLATYKRPDDFPMNTKVMLVDPGLCRTPGTRRWLTQGSLLGLLFYLLTYPLWWLVLKSPEMGAQTFLYAAMEERFSRGEGGWLLKECKDKKFSRQDVQDEEAQKLLWQYSERMIEEAEKRGASVRAKTKQDLKDKTEEEEAARELKDYKAKVGKEAGKQTGSRRSRKA